jgi:hypothetical protein
LLNSDTTSDREKQSLREALEASLEVSSEPIELVAIAVPCASEHDMTLLRSAAQLFTAHQPQWDGGGRAEVLIPSSEDPLATLVLTGLVRLWQQRSRAFLASQLEAFIYHSGISP